MAEIPKYDFIVYRTLRFYFPGNEDVSLVIYSKEVKYNTVV